MSKKLKHLIGISGGKDSAALAIYLNNKYPNLDLIYYFCDTGKELDETYQLIENIEIYLGKKVTKLEASEAKKANQNPFDFYYKAYRNYLPSPVSRWCTKNMKLDPFEEFVGDDEVISYVGIRGDEDREGYISTKRNIQSIFPFRSNIWSDDVTKKFLANGNIENAKAYFSENLNGKNLDKAVQVLSAKLDLEERNPKENRRKFLNKQAQLFEFGIPEYNHAVFNWLKTTHYPLAKEIDFELLDNEDNLVRSDIFKLLEDSGVGVPQYYNKLEYEVNGKKGEYARSRSGCFFCFFQQKIEWVWLYEQHPDLFKKAQHYEKVDEGFTWNQEESLEDLINPRRIEQIKEEHLNRKNREKSKGSKFLLDILDEEEESCLACFL